MAKNSLRQSNDFKRKCPLCVCFRRILRKKRILCKNILQDPCTTTMADGLTRALRDNGPLIVCWQMAEADQRVMVSLSLPINYLVQCLIVFLNYHFFTIIYCYKIIQKKIKCPNHCTRRDASHVDAY